MCEEGGHESFLLWENQSWGLSNSENYSSGGSQEKSADHNQIINQREHDQKDKTSRDDVETNKRNKRGRGGSRGGAKAGEKAGGSVEVREGGDQSDHEIHIWTERERRKKMRNMFANLHALLPQLPPKADKSTIVDEAVNYIKTLEQNLQKLQKQKLERLSQLQGAINFAYNEPSLTITTTPKQAFDSREAFLADQVSSSDQQEANINIKAAAAASFPNSLSSVSRQFPVSFQTWTSSNVVLNTCGNEAQISVCLSNKKPGLFTSICYILEKHKIEVMSAHVSTNSNQTMFMIQAHAVGASNHQLSDAFQVEEIFKQAAAEIMCCVSSS